MALTGAESRCDTARRVAARTDAALAVCSMLRCCKSGSSCACAFHARARAHAGFCVWRTRETRPIRTAHYALCLMFQIVFCFLLRPLLFAAAAARIRLLLVRLLLLRLPRSRCDCLSGSNAREQMTFVKRKPSAISYTQIQIIDEIELDLSQG